MAECAIDVQYMVCN